VASGAFYSHELAIGGTLPLRIGVRRPRRLLVPLWKITYGRAEVMSSAEYRRVWGLAIVLILMALFGLVCSLVSLVS
jgi:hypothetical protein